MDRDAATDEALLSAWRTGDRAAGEALFERHYAPIARFFQNKAPAAAEDLIQRTFAALIEARDRYTGASSVRTFLFAIAHNQLCTHYRVKRRAPAEMDFDRHAAADLSPGPSTLVTRRQEQRLLLEGLRRIPLDYQIVLELQYWEGCSVADIADVVGAPTGTVKTRLRRGRQLLEAKLAEIAESPELLASTVSDLERWARGVRELLPA